MTGLTPADKHALVKKRIENVSVGGVSTVKEIGFMETRRVGFAFAVIALIVAVTIPIPWAVAQTDGPALPDEFLGTWTATATQVNPPAEYPIRVVLTGGERFAPVGTIEYPSFPCGGSLIMWGSFADDEVALGETITAGQDVCLSRGFVLLTYNEADDTLSFEWRSPDELATILSATLTRAA